MGDARPCLCPDFYATPHFCLRQLGLIADRDHKGGRNYRMFRDSIARLALVTYQNDAFYDPVRGEHRDVSFGLLSHSLPLDPGSSRAWRFVWNTLFFEMCQATGGALSFDLATYRQFDGASRRLYLFLKKIFWRCEQSSPIDVRHLTVDVLGFTATLETWRLKQKLTHIISHLLDAGLLRLPSSGGGIADLFTKRAAGEYAIVFHRGNEFDRSKSTVASSLADSPLYDPLRTIGFDAQSMAYILRTFSPRLIAEWSDITLAAQERNGPKFFTSSPQAYFLDNVKYAAQGTRTPPDWWREMRRQEQQHQRQAQSAQQIAQAAKSFDEYLATEARDAFKQVMGRIFADLQQAGKSEPDAREIASRLARSTLQARFRREHPECRAGDSFSDVTIIP